jgi:hypothetical protein
MKGKKYIFCGDEGECAFTEPFMQWRSVQELPGFLQKIESTGDDRSFVLLSSLVVERYIEELLQVLVPGFATLAKNRDFTFSLKIDLVKSLRLIPLHILNAADLIRRVRNAFAHDIDSHQLEACDPKLKDAMRQLVLAVFGDGPENLASNRAMFKALTFLSVSGLESYRPNLKKLREKLDSSEVVAAWKKECHQEFMAKLEEIHKSTPQRIEDKNGWRYTYYRDGLVSIDAIDPQTPPSTIDLDVSSLNLAEKSMEDISKS